MSEMNPMMELLKVADSARGPDWEQAFLRNLPASYCSLLSPDPQVGPDGWPYLMIEISENSDQETVDRILQWLSTRGIGLAINPQKEFPDFALSYGMIWNFTNTGNFVQPVVAASAPTTSSVEISTAVTGDPRAEVLPEHVRKILREFFRDQGVLKPKILGVSPDGKSFEIAFSLESLGNPPASEHAGIAEAISWFLPPHYPILLMTEQGQPGFKDL